MLLIERDWTDEFFLQPLRPRAWNEKDISNPQRYVMVKSWKCYFGNHYCCKNQWWVRKLGGNGRVGFKWSDSHFNRTGRSVSLNDELRNKAPRHHNDYFESNKRFVEIVEDLRHDWKYFSKISEFLKFYLYLCRVYRWIFLFPFCNTKTSEFFDMAKSLATFCCSGV